MDRAKIKDIFLANGFKVPEGANDLREYVYSAAEALLAAARPKRFVYSDEDGSITMSDDAPAMLWAKANMDTVLVLDLHDPGSLPGEPEGYLEWFNSEEGQKYVANFGGAAEEDAGR